MGIIIAYIKQYLFSKKLVEICKISENDFTRNRKLSFVKLVGFLLNFTSKSLQLDLYSFADFLDEDSLTKQALSKARRKLSAMVFCLLNERLIIATYSDNIVKTFKGLRVLAIDGSTMRLPKNTELYDHYGKDLGETSVPLAQASIIYDALNQITLHAALDKYKVSEKSLAIKHITALDKLNNEIKNTNFGQDVILFDRGYPSKFLMFFLTKKKKHFLMRVSSHFLSEVNEVVASGVRDKIITISAFKKGQSVNDDFKKYLPKLNENAELQIRVVVFDLCNGQKEIVVTSLIDQEKFSYDDIYQLYGLRWNIEEGYKFYKSIAEIENFSGKSKQTIEQDFFATIFTCNICSLLMQEAQDDLEEEHKVKNEAKNLKYEYKINRNILIGTVKNEILGILLSNRDLDEYCETLKSRIKKNLVPIRPNRSFPRIFRRIKNTICRRAF